MLAAMMQHRQQVLVAHIVLWVNDGYALTCMARLFALTLSSLEDGEWNLEV